MNKLTTILILAVLFFAGCEVNNGASELISGNINGKIIKGKIMFPYVGDQRSMSIIISGVKYATHPDGRFLVKNMPNGEHELIVEENGYKSLRLRFVVGADDSQRTESIIDLGTLVLEDARGSIGGVLRLDGYGPVPKVELKLGERIIKTNDQGEFMFVGLDDGQYTVRVSDNRYFTHAIEVKINDDKPVDLGVVSIYPRKRKLIKKQYLSAKEEIASPNAN